MSKAPVRADVAQRLKEARQRIYSTASEAAEALAMKAVTLRAHENGQNGINIYDLERYARRYGVNVQWLLSGTGEIAPEAQYHLEMGETLRVTGVLKADQWFPADSPEHDERIITRTPAAGLVEIVNFTDPRFPVEIVEAFRVESAAADAHYINGTIIFCVPSFYIGIRNGDHVVVIRERGDFTSVSLCRYQWRDDAVLYQPLTDPKAEPFSSTIEKEERPHISAVVIGSLTRRPVQALAVAELKRLAAAERAGARETKESWQAMIDDAKAILAGTRTPPTDIFDSVEQAKKFASIMDATDDSTGD